MLTAAALSRAAGEARQRLKDGWALAALSCNNHNFFARELAFVAVGLHVSLRDIQMQSNQLLLTDENLTSMINSRAFDVSFFIGFRQCTGRYIRERNCPAFLGKILTQINNYSYFLQDQFTNDNIPSLHTTMALGFMAAGRSVLEGAEASVPAPRHLRNYVTHLMGQGFFFAYLKSAATNKSSEYPVSVYKIVNLIIEKAWISPIPSDSYESDVNKTYLHQDLLTSPHPNSELHGHNFITIFQQTRTTTPATSSSGGGPPAAGRPPIRSLLGPPPSSSQTNYLKRKFTQ